MYSLYIYVCGKKWEQHIHNYGLIKSYYNRVSILLTFLRLEKLKFVNSVMLFNPLVISNWYESHSYDFVILYISFVKLKADLHN